MFVHFKCIADGFYPEGTDCTVFYECRRGQATRLKCAPGLGYRPYLRTCDLITYVSQCPEITSKPEVTETYVASEMVNQKETLSQVPKHGDLAQVANEQEVLSDVTGAVDSKTESIKSQEETVQQENSPKEAGQTS